MPKPPNWPEIKKRYLQGEKPVDIAKDYDVTSKQIRDKAFREGWSRQKAALDDKIATKIEQSVERDLTKLTERLMDEYERLAFSDMARLAAWNASTVRFKDSSTLTPDQTACVSSISQTETEKSTTIKLKLHNKLGAMDSLAEIVGLLKKKKDDKPDQNAGPRIIGLPGVDPDAL